MKKTSLLILLAMLATNVQAHIVFDIKSAPSGSYYRGALRVGHGCDGSPVKEIIVTIPEGVQGAKPMPKTGWKISITRKPLAKPYVSHGRNVVDDVSEIRWTANTPEDYLPDTLFDEFVVFAKLPEAVGKLYWKTSQVCEEGRIDWNEIPVTGSGAKPKAPAPVLEILGQPEAVPHQHAH